jgi:hypothetical protein
MHAKRNTDGRLCNHSYSGKAVITYSECVCVCVCACACVCVRVCVSVALGIQHPVRMRNIVICGLPRSTIFFQIIA